MHSGTSWGHGDLVNCIFHCGGVAPLFDFLIIWSSHNSPNVSPWIGTGNYISVTSVSTEDRTDNTNQNQNLILWEEPKKDSPRASGKIASAFKFSYMTDVWAKNITILWCLLPSRCECCLPIFIWMPRNVSKLLGFCNIYSVKDKPTFWQPPLNIFRAFCLYICKRPSLSKQYAVIGQRFLTFAWVPLIGKCLHLQMNTSLLWNFQSLSKVAERWPLFSYSL